MARIHYPKKEKPKQNKTWYKKQSEHGLSAGQIVFRVFVAIAAAALCISYLSIFIDPAFMSLPYFFGLYYIPIFLINVVLLIVGLIKMRRYLVLSLVALLPSLFFADLFVKFGDEEKSVSGDEVKVMTYNVGHFCAAAKGMNAEQALGKISEFVSREAPDIICLQEFHTKDTATLGRFLQQLPYRHRYLYRDNGAYAGNITLSRYPIVNSGTVSFSRSTNLCIWSDIRINDVTVRIYNCHLQSYSLSFTNIIKRMSKKGGFTDEVKTVHEHLAQTTLRRSEQVGKMHDHIATSTLPSVVCGDFNDTPMSYTYHRLSQGHKDSFADGGRGFGATFSIFWPLLRIDYILVPENVSCDRTSITRVPYSDHYPVSTLIYF
ncbi:MAG: endonuclease/exonuclease/phosphatase family protein [Bacteroidales bacterium]|nr:endonuclease/exonuclease/phosphatase family protein [Bacteroidales bacterium]